MIEAHPSIVHFPVALLSVAALFAVLSLFSKKGSFKEIAFWNLLLGVTGAIAAVFTGLVEEQNLVHSDEIHQILTVHKFTGIGILIFSFALLTWVWVRKNKFGKKEYIFWVLFLVLGTAMIFYQGFLGGRMVFEQGAGVKPMEHVMEKEGDAAKTHSHSNSGHDHDAPDSSSSKKAIPGKMKHAHPNSTDNTNQQDTSKKQEKKKALKDMKY
jgi:uncharacterized membrane protein